LSHQIIHSFTLKAKRLYTVTKINVSTVYTGLLIWDVVVCSTCMNHPEINQFKEEDNTLIVNIHEANSQIRQLNNADSKRSPNSKPHIQRDIV
jgi:hypothetical protein